MIVAATVRLLRPGHWFKNVFVLAGVFFAGSWRKPLVPTDALLAFVAFCLASSAVYALNDVLDAGHDRAHPRKRSRPVASGAISARTAAGIATVLAIAALLLTGAVSLRLLAIVGTYLAVNVYYSLDGRRRELIDVFCIASGFILRLLAGSWGIGVEPSHWFLLCTLSLSLFLGFCKRYAELMDPNVAPEERREVLANYPPEMLRILLAATLASTLITYSLYTTSDRTIAVHGTDNLIFTLPLAMFGMFRYLSLVLRKGFGEDIVADVLRDGQLVVTVVVYVLASGAILASQSAGR